MIRCFMLEPIGRAKRGLRRFSLRDDAPCSIHGYHTAVVMIEDGPCTRDDNGYLPLGDSWPHDDPRWPTHCACGYAFTADDRWQLYVEELYRRADTGEEYTLQLLGNDGAAPAGAMWYAPWFGELWQGPDGKTLMVRLPSGHDWCVDGPSASDGYWTRTGTVPNITAMPSIWDKRPNGYHGWLQDGVLTDDLEGRTYA